MFSHAQGWKLPFWLRSQIDRWKTPGHLHKAENLGFFFYPFLAGGWCSFPSPPMSVGPCSAMLFTLGSKKSALFIRDIFFHHFHWWSTSLVLSLSSLSVWAHHGEGWATGWSLKANGRDTLRQSNIACWKHLYIIDYIIFVRIFTEHNPDTDTSWYFFNNLHTCILTMGITCL